MKMPSENVVFGVHLGSTSACVAMCKDGKAEVIANDAGDRATPAIVAFTEHDQIVGESAKQGLIRNEKNTICNAKELLGRKYDDENVQKIVKSCNGLICEINGFPFYKVEFKEKLTTFSPQQITSAIYKKMMETAERSSGVSEKHDAIVTVPVHFTEEQRKIVKEAAQEAGFKVLRVINEPTAALLAYDIGQKDHHEFFNVLVYRMGGRSLDVTIVQVFGGMYRILDTLSRQDVAGQALDSLLVEHCAAEFQRQWKTNCRENKRSVNKLKTVAEGCKHVLSTMMSAQCSVESLCDGVDFQTSISRSRFEGLCSTFVQQSVQPVTELLTRVQMQKSCIQKVILCGGCSKIPVLQQQLKDYFPEAELLSSVSPDEAIAIGAAKQASILSRFEEDELRENETMAFPCVADEICLKVAKDGKELLVPLLERHTPLPARRQRTFQLGDGEEQTSFSLSLVENNEGNGSKTVAKVVMRDFPPGGVVKVIVQIDRDGTLRVVCNELSSNKSEQLIIDAQTVLIS